MNTNLYFFILFALISLAIAQGVTPTQAEIDKKYADCMKQHCTQQLQQCAADEACVTVAKDCHKKLVETGSSESKVLEFKNCIQLNKKAFEAYQCQFTNHCTPE